VQEVIERGLAKLDPGPVGLRGAGRTDSGVHATGQVGHVTLAGVSGARMCLRDALNAHMRPERVAILAAEAVSDDFDARFSAKARHYLYRYRQPSRAADFRLQPRLADKAPDRRRGHARGGAGSGRTP